VRRFSRWAAVAAGLALAPLQPASAAGDFTGRTLTALVGFSAGGPVDSFARLVAAHIGAHIPGTPTVIVQNKPGADGMLAVNYLYNVAPKDGSMFLVAIAPFTNQYIGSTDIKFETDKFYWLGALNYSNTIYVRADLGIRSAADLLAPHKPIVIGGLAPASSRDLYMKSFLEALGYKTYSYVKGYQGTLDIRNALLRDEVNFSTESAVALVTDMASYVKDGSIIPLAQSGLDRGGRTVRDPQVPEVPTAEEAIVALHGEAARKTLEFRAMSLVIDMVALGRAVFMPPGVDPAAGAALRKAFAELNADRGFQKAAANLNGGRDMALTDGATAQKFAGTIAALAKTDPEALAYLQRMAQEKAAR